MSRTPFQSRIHEINLLNKRLNATVKELYGTKYGHLVYGLQRAMHILGERKRELRQRPVAGNGEGV